jgi:hypothetical protein
MLTLMTRPETKLVRGKVPAAIHAAVGLGAATPEVIASRVEGFKVSAKRVKEHLEWWINNRSSYYYRTTDGRYGYLA